MKILVFDTETTGLPQTKIISPDTLDKWPHIVQFSYIIYDCDPNNPKLNMIEEVTDCIIKLPSNINIPEESTKIHGITNELSQLNGLSIDIVFDMFFYHFNNVDKIIGHNINFDINMIKVELLRLIYNKKTGIVDYAKNSKNYLYCFTNCKNFYCTMNETIEFCGIEAIDKYGKPYKKFPKLLELYKKLFDQEAFNLHNSLNDIVATLRCYIKFTQKIDILTLNDAQMNELLIPLITPS